MELFLDGCKKSITIKLIQINNIYTINARHVMLKHEMLCICMLWSACGGYL